MDIDSKIKINWFAIILGTLTITFTFISYDKNAKVVPIEYFVALMCSWFILMLVSTVAKKEV